MKAQHAPSLTQAAFVVPENVACVMPQRIKGGRTSAAKATTTSVNSVLKRELNRFARIQPAARDRGADVLEGT